MTSLTDFTFFADAQKHSSRTALGDLFDGTRDALNIAHECVDRHAHREDQAGTAIRIAHADGRDEALTFAQLSDWSSRVAGDLVRRGIRRGDRIAVMLDPSLAFDAAVFGIIKAGAIVVPMFTLLGPESMRLRLADC